MKKYFFVSIFIVLTTLSFAQNKTIKGTVIDEQTQEPISNAVINVKGSNTHAVTDIDGNFTIKASDKDVLEISILGYKSAIKKACNCTMPNCKHSKIYLKQSKISLDEIVVKSNPLTDISHSVTVVDDIKKGSQPRNVTDLFKDIAGFSI